MTQGQDQRRYKILEVLGKGGFGTVYRAELIGSGGFKKQVALKVLNPELQNSGDIVQRLRDEARMLGLLRHRAIVNVDALLHLDGRWTIVMEYVDGASLRDVLSTGRVPVSVALEIVEEVAAALEVAWSPPGEGGRPLGLLHRDIKPGNVQLTPRGEVKLLDFGVAKADFGDREAHTRSLIFGSINYLAPERLDFEDTHKGDIYALGCVLFELLVGEQQPKASINPRKHRERVDEARRKVLDAHNDPDLAELIERCLEYEPERRPDARALERRARAIRRGYPEPWLKDWAEQAVPKAMAHRSRSEDEWSGSMIEESGSIGSNQTLGLFGDEATHLLEDETLPPPEPSAPMRSGPIQDASSHSSATKKPPPPTLPPSAIPKASAPTLPPSAIPSASRPGASQTPAWSHGTRSAPTTAEPPTPPPRRREVKVSRRKKRSGRVMRWVVGIAITLLLLIIAVPVLLVVAGGGGLYALLAGTGIWQEAWQETVSDTMDELTGKVRACHATLERDDVIGMLARGKDPAVADKISLLELVEVETTVEDAARDQVIDEIEYIRIEQVWLKVTAD